MRYAKITRTLADGTIEETLVELPEKEKVTSKPTKRKSSRKITNEDNTKQEKEQATPINNETIKIKQPES